MNFLITKTSNENYLKHKDFNTIQEIIDFAKKHKTELVLGQFYNPKTDKYEWGLEIYDTYREQRKWAVSGSYKEPLKIA